VVLESLMEMDSYAERVPDQAGPVGKGAIRIELATLADLPRLAEMNKRLIEDENHPNPMSVPDFLSHYYEAANGPFRSLTRLPLGEDERLLDEIRRAGSVFAGQRAPDYLAIRRELEARVRALFVARGGQPVLRQPHYMILGASPWVKQWYRDGRELRVPLSAFDSAIVSFTYGDTFPAMRYQDGKATRGRVYCMHELPDLVAAFGLPQRVNPEGLLGPDRYIEAQVWDDGPLAAYL
jgi:hypothetical protein